jgi:CRP-like cAMP-binding protein
MTLVSALPAFCEAPHIDLDWLPPRPGLHRHFDHLRDHGMRLRFRRNETVFAEHETAAHVYRLVSGCVRLCRHVRGGRRHVNEFMFADDIFGVGDFTRFPYAAEAVGPALVVAYPRALFEHLGEGNAALQTDLMSHFKTLLERAQQHLFVTSCLSARERVASFILQMHANTRLVTGSRVELPMTRQEIADYLGLTVETICRALAALRDAGLIAIPSAHKIAVIDPETLRLLAEGRRNT